MRRRERETPNEIKKRAGKWLGGCAFVRQNSSRILNETLKKFKFKLKFRANGDPRAPFMGWIRIRVRDSH